MNYLLQTICFIIVTVAVLIVEVFFIEGVFEIKLATKGTGLLITLMLLLISPAAFVIFFFKKGFMNIRRELETPALRVGRIVGVLFAIYSAYKGYWIHYEYTIGRDYQFLFLIPGFLFVGYSIGHIIARAIFWVHDSLKQTV